MNVRSLAGLLVAGSALLVLPACNDGDLVNIPASNNGPVAVVSGESAYVPLDYAMFDGSNSYDPDGTITSWQWLIVDRPVGADPTNAPMLINGGRQAEFFVDLAGDYTIRLTVTDDAGGSDSEEFTFSAVPYQAIHVQLTWNKAHADIDLHLVNDTAGGQFYANPYDCFFANSHPNWGSASSAVDDPRLDIDDVEGYGPENINLDAPAAGTRYHVYVHSYNDDGDNAVEARVRIYLSGELKWEGVQVLSDTGKVWNTVTIDWPLGAVTPTGGVFDH